MAKAFNDAKAQSQQLAEEKRHNRAMEITKGTGLYLRPYKGYGMYLKPLKKLSIKLPRQALTDQEIRYGSRNKILYTEIKNSTF